MTSFKLPEGMEGTHDLKCLPSWGPYTKRHMGVSHIPSLKEGFRFDFFAAPGLHRRRVEMPNVMWDSGYSPLAASPDLRFYSHRHEIGGDGKLYAEIEFFNLDEGATAFRCTLFNKRRKAESMALHLFANLNFPQMRDYDLTPVRPVKPVLPSDAVWTPAMRYAKFSFGKTRGVTESLSPDGRPHGQTREHGFSGGEGCAFGRDDGDKLAYAVKLAKELRDGALLVRFKVDKPAKVRVSGAFEGELALEPEGFKTLTLKAKGPLSGALEISFEKLSGGEVKLDGFALLPAAKTSEARFENVVWNPAPKMSKTSKNSFILKYDDIATHYGLAWDAGESQFLVREYFLNDIDCGARKQLNNLLSEKIGDDKDGHQASVAISPVFVEAGGSAEIRGVVCQGAKAEVEKRVKSFDAKSPALEKALKELSAKAFKTESSPGGAKYKGSQSFMAALTLSQVVYPVNTAGTMIRHSTPGRWWDCLYTWDSGFMGLGLASLDVERAVWCLNAYMNQGEAYAAFIHHGTPLPVQHYLFMELWNRTRSVELLERFLPPLEKYYKMLAGRLPGSTTRNLKSGLVRTWDCFYNSGGWDDYPPQVAVHALKLEQSVAPAVSSAHLTRAAKILRAAARKLGRPTDIYDEDIASLSDALNRHAWDPETGYYSYVKHDRNGEPCGFLRHESGVNFNKGLDGVSPLVAGIASAEQEKAMTRHLENPEELWTPVGISTVDRSAPYYSDDGYWNGCVWMPHQWFMWKAALDLGKADFAFKIAKTALDVWERETKGERSAFEHFEIKGGRGTGWHHFSGLSCPVLSWFEAYFRPGSFTAGFDVFIDSLRFAERKRGLEAELSIDSNRKGDCVCVAALDPERSYESRLDGAPARAKRRLPGVLEIRIPLSGAPRRARLSIRAL